MEATEFLKNILFKCNQCNEEFSYKDWNDHCHGALIKNCLFHCDKFNPYGCEPKLLEAHLKDECNSRLIKCRDCNYEVYKVYSDSKVLHEKGGHNCVFDTHELFTEKMYEEVKTLRIEKSNLA